MISERLQYMAQQVAAHPWYLGHALACYQARHGLSDDELASYLGLADTDALTLLKLCRAPLPASWHTDLVIIACRFNLTGRRHVRLAALLKAVAAAEDAGHACPMQRPTMEGAGTMDTSPTLVRFSIDCHGDGYLVQAGMVLGPLPADVWQNEEEVPWTRFLASDLAAAGYHWRAGAPPGDLAFVTAYDQHDDPEGTVYEARGRGYRAGLQWFLDSPYCRMLIHQAPAAQHGQVPALVLHADGRHEIVADALTQPIVIPIAPYPTLASHLTMSLDQVLEERLDLDVDD